VTSDVAVAFDRVTKEYRRGTERANLRAALPGRFGRTTAGATFRALDDLSFGVDSGEIVGVVGPNGAGKSTLLKLLARVIAPTRGRVTTRGRVASLIELGVGFHPDLTGTENVRFSAAVLGMGKRQAQERFDAIVQFAGIESFMNTPVKRYSSGMLARLGFSVASHLDADVLLIDEVMSVGDADFQRRGYERMKDLRRSGATLLFVTHNLVLVPEICQRAVRLDRGRIVDDGAARDVVDRYSVGGRHFDDISVSPEDPRIIKFALSTIAVRPGEPVRAEVEVHVPGPVADARLTLVIRTEYGLHAAGIDVDGAQEHLSAGRSFALVAMIEAINLSPRTYTVLATIVQRSGDALITLDQAGVALTVSGEDVQYGVANLNANFSFRAL
jgi:ABC-type polysaccharide/polyol phosphate transport system ATPase subunit